MKSSDGSPGDMMSLLCSNDDHNTGKISIDCETGDMMSLSARTQQLLCSNDHHHEEKELYSPMSGRSEVGEDEFEEGDPEMSVGFLVNLAI